MDPEGLYTLVIYNGPTSGNPFGHTAIATSGSGIYSPGNNPNDPSNNYSGASVTEYMQREVARRDSTLYVLDTTPEQEKAIIDYMKGQTTTPNMFPDNCAGRVGDALRSGGVILRDPIIPGISLPTTPFPSTIARALDQMVTDGQAGSIFIPQNSTVPQTLSEFNPKTTP